MIMQKLIEILKIMKKNKYSTLWDEIFTLRKVNKLFLANDKLQDLENLITSKITEVEHKREAEMWKQKLEECEEISLLKVEVQEASTVMKDLESEDSWTLMRDTVDMKTYYRHEKNTPVHSFKINGNIPCNVFNLLVLVNEVDMYHTFVPLLHEARVIKGNNYRRIAYIKENLPWPFAPRDAVLYGYCIDNVEKSGNILVVFRSAIVGDLELNLKDVPPSVKQDVRCDCKIAGLLLKPTATKSTYVNFCSNVDPKLSHVPYWLLNMAVSQLVPLGLTMLAQKSNNLKGTEYEKRIKKDHNNLYREIRDTLYKYIPGIKIDFEINSSESNIT